MEMMMMMMIHSNTTLPNLKQYRNGSAHNILVLYLLHMHKVGKKVINSHIIGPVVKTSHYWSIEVVNWVD